MCGCEPGFVCGKCAGTRFEDGYPDDDPRDDEQRERDAFSEGRSAYDPSEA